MLGKWLARAPSLLIIDEPTRGIDVGTKAEVHRILDELVAEGLAVLMISSELPEVLGVADRILVLREGRLTAEFARADADRGHDHAGGDRAGRGGRGMTAPAAPRTPSTCARAGAEARAIPAGEGGRDHGAGAAGVRRHDAARSITSPPPTASSSCSSGAALIALLGVGETLVIVTRNVDLSVGSVARPVRLRRRRACSATTLACR